MKIIRDMPVPEKCVLTVGKFESIHLGHRALINEVVGRAKQIGAASAVMVFNPYPYSVFGDAEYTPLFTEDERIHLLEGLGVDYLLVQTFDREFAALSPEDFCDKVFRDFKARVIIVGEGYCFGHGRKGNVNFLRERAEMFGATVHVIAPTLSGSEKVSTSYIRSLLTANKLPEAQALLSFPFFVLGTTRKGRQIGREIGFPTMNLYPCDNDKSKFLPMDGVYATLTVIDGVSYRGITNVGFRPTVSEQKKCRSVETHLLESPDGLTVREFYGQTIKTEFLHFIRPEKKFASIEELKAGIAEDIKRILI